LFLKEKGEKSPLFSFAALLLEISFAFRFGVNYD